MLHFFQGVKQGKPSWKLLFPKVVLDFLASDQFLPANDPPLTLIALKTAFFEAITFAGRVSEIAPLGAKEPFLFLFPDQMVLTPILGFLPKVSSDFHSLRDIVLPSFQSLDSGTPYPLDMGQAHRYTCKLPLRSINRISYLFCQVVLRRVRHPHRRL